MSSSETVGLTLSMAFRKSLSLNGGSSKSSVPISVHAFSTASGSPGEQGVHFIFDGSVGQGTYLKCVADSTLRTGCMRASRTSTAISEPVYLIKRSQHRCPSEYILSYLPIRTLCQFLVVFRLELAWCSAYIQFEHLSPCLNTRERNVYALLKSLL